MSIAKNKVVVGYDGSDESRTAVEWAARVAARRSTALLVVTATGTEDQHAVAELPDLTMVDERLAYRTAEAGADLARTFAQIQVDAVGLAGGAPAALTSLSSDAQLVVVGHRGTGKFRGTRVGSVAFAVCTHAKCPVVVVRDTLGPFPGGERPSVVGVDGSPASDIALDQAAAWSDSSQSPLRIVVAWKRPLARPWSTDLPDEDGETHEDAGSRAARRASQIAERAVTRVHTMHPDVRTEHMIGEGRPAEVIVEAAEDASLIIVGARGRGDFASLLLGSVSREVIQHAHCPVYVVR